jgi:hypothetical protein
MAALSGKYVLVIPTEAKVTFNAQDPSGLLVAAPVARPRPTRAPSAAPVTPPFAVPAGVPDAPSPQLVHPVRLRPV